ncbi:MAG: hypothetical protein ACHQII_02965 [Bacteroidia bacterium]
MKKLKTNLAIAFACISTVLCAQQQTPTANPTDTLATKQKVKEYGIGFTSLNSYSLQYRWGTPKLLYRINANIGFTGLAKNDNTSGTYDQNITSYSSSTTETQTKTPATLSTGVGFSMLTFKQINPKFGLMIGGIAGLTYSYTTGQNTLTTSNYSTGSGSSSQTTITKTTAQTLQPYLGCVLGAYYKFNPSFIIYAEISPSIFYAATQTTGNTTYQNNPASINIKTSDSRINNSNIGLSGITNSGAMLTLVYRITK